MGKRVCWTTFSQPISSSWLLNWEVGFLTREILMWNCFDSTLREGRLSVHMSPENENCRGVCAGSVVRSALRSRSSTQAVVARS